MSSLETIAMRKFSLTDQVDFGKFSCDINPIHVDPIAARRTLHGECIVHGMHALLWSLEQLTIKTNYKLYSLKARFSNHLALDCETKCLLDKKLNKICLMQNGIICSSITFSLADTTPNLLKKKFLPQPLKAAEVSFESLSVGNEFDFKLYRDENYKNVSFPNLSKVYGDILIAEIAGLSHLVGMECPGKHSLFAAVTLSLCNKNKNKNKNSKYKILKMDDRLNLIHLEVFGLSFNALLECFFRPKPTINITYQECLKLVSKGEFSNVNALIIGGSRGLGECTAKLISAGGGRSFITYYQGADDATNIKQNINTSNGLCETLPLNISEVMNLNYSFKDLGINQVYYFASPKITEEKESEYEIKKNKYIKFYCDYFKVLANKLIMELNELSIFYPSPAFIDEKNKRFKSYIEAKLVGEKICKKLSLSKLGLNIIAPRLPTLQTDQNQSITGNPERVIKNAFVLLPYIRQMNNFNK